MTQSRDKVPCLGDNCSVFPEQFSLLQSFAQAAGTWQQFIGMWPGAPPQNRCWRRYCDYLYGIVQQDAQRLLRFCISGRTPLPLQALFRQRKKPLASGEDSPHLKPTRMAVGSFGDEAQSRAGVQGSIERLTARRSLCH